MSLLFHTTLMANRHLARSLVMQTLFAFDFQKEARALTVTKDQDTDANNWNVSDEEALTMLQYAIDEFAPGSEDKEFLQNLLLGIVRKRSVIDEVLKKAAPEWPLEKINAVDRNVLRVGLYELLFGDHAHVPPKVAINESIELAKTFGGESSGRFVNGVLGAVYKEMGEPGKEQKSKKQTIADVPYEEMPIEKKAGAVIYALHEGMYYLAMVHDVFGYWTLSKGGVKEGKTPAEAVIDEIRDEINIEIRVIDMLGENEYIANHPEKGKIRKQVSYFLAEADYQPLVLKQESGGLDNVKWFPIFDVPELRMYEDVTQLMTKAAERLLGNK